MTKKIQKGLRKQIMGKKETEPQRRVGWRWKRCLKLTWSAADRTDKRGWQRLCQISWLKRVWKMPPAAAARSRDTQTHVYTRMCVNARMCLLLFTGTRCTLGYTRRLFMSQEIFRMSGNWPTWSMKTINLTNTESGANSLPQRVQILNNKESGRKTVGSTCTVPSSCPMTTAEGCRHKHVHRILEDFSSDWKRTQPVLPLRT